MGRVGYVPSLLCAEFVMGRVCHVPSLLCAELSLNHSKDSFQTRLENQTVKHNRQLVEVEIKHKWHRSN